LFTWSNQRDPPTLTRIDRVLVSIDWDLEHPDALLQALPSSLSNHVPLHVSISASLRPRRRFKFELAWMKLDGLDEAIKEAWTCDQRITDPFRRLDALFRNAADGLHAWGQRKTGNIKLQLAIANTVIFHLDAAQDRRCLSQGEIWLRKSLKLAILGLPSLERTMARQRSRIRWLRDGDANSKLFHAVANGRRTKNFIASIKVGEEIITEQDRKVEAFSDAYMQLLGSIQNRDYTLDLEALGLVPRDLQELDVVFTEAEVWDTIKDMPADRAPGPDGFIGAFYQRAWPVIKADIMTGLHKLGVGDGRGFARLNRALITLIPKKQDATTIGDYRPISLVHSFSKLFSKVVANRLRKRLPDIISANQSAFVKRRCLHDNFLLVRQVARRINQRR
jgi:hypothetical protein